MSRPRGNPSRRITRTRHGKLNLIDLGGLSVGGIYCINLKTRKDRRQNMKKQGKKRKFTFNFHTVNLNEKSPVRGCLESHLSLIRMAKNTKLPNIMILEDDAKIKYNRLYIPEPPKEWDILYLGGDVQKVLDDEESNLNLKWKRTCCTMAHAYVVNKNMYDKLLSKGYQYDGPIDKFYCEEIHPDHRCYIITPTIFTQFDGYSDVQQKKVTYGAESSDLKIAQLEEKNNPPPDSLFQAPCEIVPLEGGGETLTLKLPDIPDSDLPYVSIITPTYCRKEFFSFAVRNFYRFDYPSEKLEWVIADDTPLDTPSDEMITGIIPGDKRIKYIRCDVANGGKLKIGHKRNVCISCTTYDYIVHMDDDDYYPPCSIKSRIKLLLANPDKSCVGSTKVGIHDIIKNASAITYENDISDNLTRLNEATLAYKKEFWFNRKFNEKVPFTEGYFFIKGRYDELIDMPYQFVILALMHKTNLTREFRKFVTEGNKSNDDKSHTLLDTVDKETREFISLIKETL